MKIPGNPRFVFLLTMFFLGLISLGAQDTVRHLIISEVRVDLWRHAYVELTNMGDSAVDLSQFSYGIMRNNYPNTHLEGNEVYLEEGTQLWASSTLKLSGTLMPGESYLIMAVQDGLNNNWIFPRTVQSIGLLERADKVVHFPDWDNGDQLYATKPYIPRWEMWGDDSISDNYSVMLHRDRDAPALFWHWGDSLTVLVDQALGTMQFDEFGSGHYVNDTDPPKSVAGIESAHDNHTLIRKFSVKEGETNWELAAGVDAASSSWIVIPHNDDIGHMAWETEGVHGDFHLDYSSIYYDINESAGTITVPWGTEKYDSIRFGFNLGPGMAWQYLEYGDQDRLRSSICQTGDSLILYCAGDVLETKGFRIIVNEPDADMVQAFARESSHIPDPEDPDYNFYAPLSLSGIQYGITKNQPGGDQIFNIPFAEPVDTLLKLIEVAPNASYEFIWARGVQSSEISYGDHLRITGGDGSSMKDYLLNVNPYVASDNVDLKAITWPDRPGTFLEGWKGDTIPGFHPSATSYQITLPHGTTHVPALLFESEDINADVSVDRAISLRGGKNERTTTVTIVSESDTMLREIKVIFEVFNPDHQKYISDPVFSKFIIRDWWSAGGMEILNPSDELIDLSEYMIVRSDETNPADAITSGFETDSTTWLERWLKMVPGFKWQSYEDWTIQPGILEFDATIDPFVEAKDVFVLWKLNNNESRRYSTDIDPAYGGRADYILNNDLLEPGVYYNPWNEPLSREKTVAFPLFPTGAESRYNYFLFKILGDSVRDGLKRANDPNDFELVDAFGHPVAPWVLDGQTWASPPGENWSAYRKPDKYWGVTELGANFGDQETSHYTLTQDYEGSPPRRMVNQLDMGSFTLDPITGHLSTVSSLVYIVSRGHQGTQTIEGVSSSEKVSDFFANLIKANPSQTLVVRNSVIKTGSSPIIEGDTLHVTSQTGNTTKYHISTLALDDDNILVAKAGSGLAVDITGETGSVSGFTFGTTIRELKENLTVPQKAILNVVDDGNNLVPLQRYNNDMIYVDLVATGDHLFEVIAQNGDVVSYSMLPFIASSDAFVLSDIYTVTEEPTRVISGIEEGTSVPAFLTNIYPALGATIKVRIKTGQERNSGALSVDDKLEVRSEDGSNIVEYLLKFEDSEIFIPNTKPEAGLESDFLTVGVGQSFSLKVNATDDGRPGPLTFKWEVTGGKVSNVSILNDQLAETEAIISETGSYILQIAVSDGEYSIELPLYIIAEEVQSGFSSELVKQARIYPNPASDRLTVEFPGFSGPSTLSIYDLLGTVHHLSNMTGPVNRIDLSNLETGVYIIAVRTENMVQFERISIISQ